MSRRQRDRDRPRQRGRDHPDEAAGPTEMTTSQTREASGGSARRAVAETGQNLRQTLKEAGDWRALRKTPYGLRSILLLIVTGAVFSFDGAIYSVALPDVVRDLELGDDLGTLFTIINFAGFVLIFVQLGLAHWMDKVNRAKVIGASFTLSGIFSLVTARATSLGTFAWPRAFDSLSDTAATTPQFSLLADYYPTEVRGKAFAAVGVLARGGRLFAPLAIGYLIVRTTTDDLSPNWELPYLITGSALVVLGLLCFFFLKEPTRGYMERKAQGASEEVARRPEERPSFGEGWRTIWGIRTLRRFFIGTVFAAAAGVIYFRFFSLFLSAEYGMSALQIGGVFAVVGAGGILGAYIGGGIVDSLTRRRPQRVLIFFGFLSLLAAAAFALIAIGLPVALMYVLVFVLGLGFGLIGPARSVIFAQIVPAHMRTLGLNMLVLADVPAAIIFQFFVLPFLGDTGSIQGVLFQAVPLFVIGALVDMSAAGFLEGDMRSAQKSQLATEEARRTREAGEAKLLVCRGVDVEYDGIQVLFDVDLDVREGEIVALLGTNGAGKSTLLKAISGVQQASGGAVVYDGRDITRMPPHEVAARRIVHVPGGKGIFPELSVEENLVLGNWLTDPGERKERLEEVYEIFPLLRQRLGARAGALSGGEQQMLSLAQAFLAKPRLLLIDELSLGLAPQVVQELIEIVRRINERGVTVVVVEQSVNVALTVAERAVFMEKGEVRFIGPTEELLRRPDILRAVYVKGTGALEMGPARAQKDRRRELEEARPVLEVRNISKAYGGVQAVEDVSFDLREGEVLGLIGPNGAGKTTIFDVISGYQLPDSGSIVFDGVDVSGMGPDERARRRLVRRFQDARLFPALTVYENLLLAFDRRLDVRNMVLNSLQLPQVRRAERRVRDRADRLIELLDLGAFEDKFVKELSTGLRRITDLACVLATDPRILLLDEPSTGIAQAEAEQLVPMLRRVRAETGCSMLVIEHDMTLISSISDELLALDQGRVLLRGDPQGVLNDDRVVEAYLGTSEDVIRRSGTKVRR